MKAEIILTDNNINIDLNEPTIDVSTEDGFSVTIIGGVGPQGNRGPEGPKGEKGDDYILTEEDKEEIAELAAEKVDAPVKDVQVSGVSILDEQGVANAPIATQFYLGVTKGYNGNGINIDAFGNVSLSVASTAKIKDGLSNGSSIPPGRQHESTFYGLAKAAGDATQSASSNPVGQYTDEAKAAIQAMLDVPAKADIPEVPVQDVQINGTSVLDANGVANVPIASSDHPGVATISNSFGLFVDGARLKIYTARSSDIKSAIHNTRPITPINQNESTFYGLAKAAGDTTQSASSNRVGQYTDEAKTAIQTMLDVPAKADIPEVPVQDVQLNGNSILDENGTANIPYAGSGIPGVVKTDGARGTAMGTGSAAGVIMIQAAGSVHIKSAGTGNYETYRPIVPRYQHESVFYGLAKVAGHDEKDSTLPVGQYTDEAKAAIQTMIGIPTMAEIITAVHDSYPAAEEATF